MFTSWQSVRRIRAEGTNNEKITFWRVALDSSGFLCFVKEFRPLVKSYSRARNYYFLEKVRNSQCTIIGRQFLRTRAFSYITTLILGN